MNTPCLKPNLIRSLAIMVASLCFARGVQGAGPFVVKNPPTPADIQRLIRNAVWNELMSMRNRVHRYEYVHQDITPGSTQTTMEIETAQGRVARLIAVNGTPPDERRCQRNLAQLARIALSPRLERSRFKEQQAEMSRREQLFRVLPQAFIFHYDGTEKGLIRLKYEPNPAFRPHSRVGGVLMGLAGTMWIDPSSQHLVKIDGHVIKTVTFGWGILARLNPGGQYLTEEKKLSNGDWRLATLEVNLRGTILLVKKLTVDMKEIYGSYREVSKNLTLPAAAQMLDRLPVQCVK